MGSVLRKTNLFQPLAIVILLTLAAVPTFGAGPATNSESSAAPVVGEKPTYNEAALFIGGIGNRQGPLTASENKPAWTRYARFINPTWERFDKKHLAPMREWAARELGPANTATVFYPFSGPDFVNLYTLFPRAKTYLMIALEPVGEMPDFASQDNGRFFGDLEHSLYDLLQLNFFITDKLQTSLGNAEFKGVLPILMFFLAREKAQVLDVRYWVMKPDGAIEESPAAGPRTDGKDDIAGVRLDFTRAGSEDRQTLYYFRLNLRNNFLANREKFVSFLKGFGPLTTFAKAASYLMHRPGFSAIRQFILDQSQFVLEGDSAIPLKYFEPGAWNLKFFGTYTSPIARFKAFRQPDLAEVYQQGREVFPLPFGIDYCHRVNTSNLLFAAKKVNLALDAAK